jgi:hypothetical protein
MRSIGMAKELLPVKDVDRDQIRLLARREVAAVLRRDRRTWVHTVREEFATYYPLAELMQWWRSFYPDRAECRSEPASSRTRYSLR